MVSRKSALNIHQKDWCWSWSFNTLATWCEELPHWKRPWCWEGWKAGGDRDDSGWDGLMASPTQWTWVWVTSGSWWWTGRPGVLQSMGSQRVRHDWATELSWIFKRCMCVCGFILSVPDSEQKFFLVLSLVKSSMLYFFFKAIKQVSLASDIGEWNHWYYNAIFKIDNQQAHSVWHRELCSIFCNNLNRKKIWKRIHTCICITESL